VIDIICIGTPYVIGDSVGPRVGTKLRHKIFEQDVKIIGTMTDPVMLSNYSYRLKELRSGATVIAVDSAVGPSVGNITYGVGSLAPGSGIGHSLQSVGDISVKCYTSEKLRDLLSCSEINVKRWVNAITTELLYLISFNEKERIYKEYFNYIEKTPISNIE